MYIMSNTKKRIFISIIIVLVALLGVTQYMVYKNFIVGNNDNIIDTATIQKKQILSSETEKEEKIEVLDITNSEVRQLYNKISKGINFNCGINDYYTNKKVIAMDIVNEVAYNIALSSLLDNDNGTGITIGQDFTEEMINNEIAKIFGKNYKFINQEYGTCIQYKYDINTKTYKYSGGKCNSTCKNKNMVKIVKALKKNNTIEIYPRVLFIDSKPNSLKYYKDYDRTLSVDLITDKIGIPYEIDENYAKGSLYKLIFTKEDNNYVFTSSELVVE